MIPLNVTLTVEQIPLDRIIYPTSGHWPRTLDLDQIRHYTTLLLDNPQMDTIPIHLQPLGEYHTIANGRHRFIAHMIAGRETIAALVVRTEKPASQ